MSTGFEAYIVTTDPRLLAQLHARFDELGSWGLAAFAHSLGLFPPGYEPSQEHSISEYAPPGHSGAPFLVWDAGLDSSDAEQSRADRDEDDDLDDGTGWAALLQVVDVEPRPRS